MKLAIDCITHTNPEYSFTNDAVTFVQDARIALADEVNSKNLSTSFFFRSIKMIFNIFLFRIVSQSLPPESHLEANTRNAQLLLCH